jgi:hypothetical protein
MPATAGERVRIPPGTTTHCDDESPGPPGLSLLARAATFEDERAIPCAIVMTIRDRRGGVPWASRLSAIIIVHSPLMMTRARTLRE